MQFHCRDGSREVRITQMQANPFTGKQSFFGFDRSTCRLDFLEVHRQVPD